MKDQIILNPASKGKESGREKFWTGGTYLRRCVIFSRPTNKFFGRENIVRRRRPVQPVQTFFSPRIFHLLASNWSEYW